MITEFVNMDFISDLKYSYNNISKWSTTIFDSKDTKTDQEMAIAQVGVSALKLIGATFMAIGAYSATPILLGFGSGGIVKLALNVTLLALGADLFNVFKREEKVLNPQSSFSNLKQLAKRVGTAFLYRNNKEKMIDNFFKDTYLLKYFVT